MKNLNGMPGFAARDAFSHASRREHHEFILAAFVFGFRKQHAISRFQKALANGMSPRESIWGTEPSTSFVGAALAAQHSHEQYTRNFKCLVKEGGFAYSSARHRADMATPARED